MTVNPEYAPTRCPGCGRDYATADRALTCACGAGLAAMQRAGLVLLNGVSTAVGVLASGIEDIGNRLTRPPGQPTLEQLASRLAEQQSALDEMALREMERDMAGLFGDDLEVWP